MENTANHDEPNPAKILDVGMSFFASKTLLAAVNFELFTVLAEGEQSGSEIGAELGLHPRGLYDFLDALVALGFLSREGIKETSRYRNSPDADLFLDKKKPTYVGGMLEMCNSRLFRFWADLDEGLKTGKPQNEVKSGDKPMFEELYSDPARMREFVMAMGAIQMGNFIVFSKAFDFSGYKTLCDVGGSGAHLSSQVAASHPHMKCTSFDLPSVTPIAREVVEKFGLADRVEIAEGDFFNDPLPAADVITMGNILHDWGKADKLMLIKKAYDALPEGGALVVIESIIDDDRRHNIFGLLMSLNMLIETEEGYDFSGADFRELALEAGFRETFMMPLTGPSSAAIAVK
jgi:precorrin-6B methylase 2